MSRTSFGIIVLLFCLGPCLEARQDPPKVTLLPAAGGKGAGR